MDASTFEVLFDPLKCSKLSMEQKRELVYQVSKWSEGANDILHSWPRQDILQILCAELGKERKYTTLTKSKIIEHLLKIVEKKSQNRPTGESDIAERTPKRQRKSNHPNLLADPEVYSLDDDTVVYCKNSSCKAIMNGRDEFCKRCSCCICFQYDDNKDPGLWLVCSPDPPFRGISCGMSCHIECALRHEGSRMFEGNGLDGSFCCASCGKVNDLLGYWRKQLVVARDTRRVDILCYRLSLAQKILAGTQLYSDLCGGVDEAVKKLEDEVGPLTGFPVKMGRGIVNRLSSGSGIQSLCASAVESLDLMLSKRVSDTTPSDCFFLVSKLVRIQDIRASSLTVILNYEDNSNSENVEGYLLWHRKAVDKDYPFDPICRISPPNTMFLLSNLTPATDYLLKVAILDKDREMGSSEIPFRTGDSEDGSQYLISNSPNAERSQSPTTNCSSLSNPSSVEDENNGKKRQKKIKEEQVSCEPKSSTGLECIPYSGADLQITPYKSESRKNDIARKNSRREIRGKTGKEPRAGSSSRKRSVGEDGDKDFEHYVKVIRWLECEGHIETEFRQKFLTWFTLRATSQEVRVVKVFIDTFMEDSESLAGQIVDSFSDVVMNERRPNVPTGFCLKLRH